MSEIEKVTVTDITTEELMDLAAAELQAIDAEAEFTLAVVAQAVKTRAALKKGRVLIRYKEKIPYGEWERFLKRDDVKLLPKTADNFIRAAKEAEALSALGADNESVEDHPYITLHFLSFLPPEIRDSYRSRIVEGEKIPYAHIQKELAKPEVKLQKAEEELESWKEEKSRRLEKREEARSLGRESGIPLEINSEYHVAKGSVVNSDRAIKNLEAKIEKLKAEVEAQQAEKQNLQSAVDHSDAKLHAVQEELDKMKFDDEISIGLMVKRTGYNLQNMVPQVLADIQRFSSAKERFPDELRKHLEDQIKQLSTYLTESYA